MKVGLLVACWVENSAVNSVAWLDHSKAGSWDCMRVALLAAAKAEMLVEDWVEQKVVS